MTHGARRVSIRVGMPNCSEGYGLGQSVQWSRTRECAGTSICSWNKATGPARWGRGEGGTEAKCGARSGTRLDYTNNVIAVSFPRQCVSSPRWVKFRVLGYRYGESGGYLDDALRDEPFHGDNPAQSRRVLPSELTSPLRTKRYWDGTKWTDRRKGKHAQDGETPLSP